MEKFRAAILLKNLKTIGKNFNTKKEAEDYILEIADKEEVKTAYIKDRETNEREKVF